MATRLRGASSDQFDGMQFRRDIGRKAVVSADGGSNDERRC